MSTVLNDAPEVRAIAEELIQAHHPHLVEHRVRVEYVFSDAEIETNGKTKWADARKVNDLTAFLAGEPEEPMFEPLTYVCTWCRRWCTSEEYHSVECGDDVFALCPRCNENVSDWDLTTNISITRLTKAKEKASDKELAGPPLNPGFFVITVYETFWNRMRDETKRAVVDHELMHCGASLDKFGDVKLWLRPHDLEEFSVIVERHGYEWRGTIKDFICAVKRRDSQMALQFEEAASSGVAVGGN